MTNNNDYSERRKKLYKDAVTLAKMHLDELRKNGGFEYGKDKEWVKDLGPLKGVHNTLFLMITDDLCDKNDVEFMLDQLSKIYLYDYFLRVKTYRQVTVYESIENRYGDKLVNASFADGLLYSGRIDLLKTFINHGYNVKNLCYNNGILNSIGKIKKYSIDFLEYLYSIGVRFESVNISRTSELWQCKSELYLMDRVESIDEIKRALKIGFNLDVLFICFITSRRSFYDLEKELIEYFFSVGVNTKYVKDLLPFYNAAVYRQRSTIDFLISKGLDIDQTDEYGSTAIIKACRKYDYHAIRKLLKQNPDLTKGEVPLIFDLMHGVINYKSKCDNDGDEYDEERIIKITQILIQAGLDVSLKNSDDRDIVEVIKRYNLGKIESFLEEQIIEKRKSQAEKTEQLKETEVTIKDNKVKCANNNKSSIESVKGELIALKELLDLDVITTDEFNSKKKELLGL